VIRAARPGDADAIAAVWLRVWRTAYRGLVPDGVLEALRLEDRRALWRGRLARGEPALVAEHDGAVAGYCRVLRPSRDVAGAGEIAGLYVDRRGLGLGDALLRAALAELRAEGWPEAALWVFAGNRAAQRFYARFGFAPDGATGCDEGTGLGEIRLRADLAGRSSVHLALAHHRLVSNHRGAPADAVRLHELDQQPDHADDDQDHADRLNRDAGQRRVHRQPEHQPDRGQ